MKTREKEAGLVGADAEFMKLAKSARIMDVPVCTLRGLAHKGQFPPILFIGRTQVVSISEFNAWRRERVDLARAICGKNTYHDLVDAPPAQPRSRADRQKEEVRNAS